MKVIVAFGVLLGLASGSVIPATTLVRTPSQDSAIIRSDRIGGNFAYSTVEGHAYTAYTPVVQRITAPVGVSYTAHQVPLGFATAPLVSQPFYAQQQQQFFGSPFFQRPVIAQTPGVISQTPIYGGAQSPGVIGQAPIYGGIAGLHPSVIAQNPIYGGGFGGIGGINGISGIGGIGGLPGAGGPAAQPNPAQTPVEGTVIDEDTVAVETA